MGINDPIEVDEPVKPSKVVEEAKQTAIEAFVQERPSYEIAETEEVKKNNLLYWLIAILIITVILILIF